MNIPPLTSGNDEWLTPPYIYDPLHEEFDFNFDPCPLTNGPLTNGLMIPWHGRVFCNPPYSNIKRWMEKCLLEIRRGECEVIVALVPARTSTAWFHDYVYPHAELRFVRGRIRFLTSGGVHKYNAPFPSLIAVWRKSEL